MRSNSAIRWVLAGCVLALGCGPTAGGGNTTDDGGHNVILDDAGKVIQPTIDAPYEEYVDAGPPQPNYDAFVKDPPPQYCGPEGNMVPATPPTGTVDCPDDKNNEGCPCSTTGKKAACWPGFRVDRSRGICHDGETECVAYDDVQSFWGPCKGYVLPTPGARTGQEACNCFSAGEWQIDNLSPCFVDYGTGTYAVATYLDTTGQARCPTKISASPPPAPEPGKPFSPNRLTVDCQGQFKLCFRLRAGDENAPLDTDCQLAETCVDAWYPEKNMTLELPPLPSWNSKDSACAKKFVDSGGYAEMTVQGLSVECDPIDNGSGKAYVFHSVGYCPLICNTEPSRPECANCGNGTSGGF
jgi:hypothetical protein